MTDILINREFNAPRARVWKAFTEADALKEWWGPKNYTCPTAKIDFRAGGKYLYAMRSAEGQVFWSTGTYLEILPGRQFTASDSFANEQGEVISAKSIGMPGDWPAELKVTVSLEERAGKTQLTLRHVGIPKEMKEMCDAGWNESLDKLAQSVERETGVTGVQPYLVFDGVCEEALDFYQRKLGASIQMLIRVKEAPPGDEPARPGTENKIMHVVFSVGGTTLLASDGHCLGKPNFQGFALSLNVASPTDADRIFNALAEGGEVRMPISETFFSPRFGMVADKFGVTWMVFVPRESQS